MEDDWEQIAEKQVAPPKPIINENLNKWDGEDEEEEVKDSWEEEEEEKKDEEKIETKTVPKAKAKKTLASKIAEKEKLAREEERLQKELEEEELELTPEEKLAEKLRIQKLQEESDLKTALETLGVVVPDKEKTGIDSINPTNKAEFSELAEAISKKVSQFKNKDEFPLFIEELVRSLCANLTSLDIRKTKTTLDTLCLEKQKLEKEKTKKSKPKAKAKLRLEGDNANVQNMAGYEDYDYDDFM